MINFLKSDRDKLGKILAAYKPLFFGATQVDMLC